MKGCSKVKVVYKTAEDGKLALGVKVENSGATVGDLLGAWEPLAGTPGIGRKYSPEDDTCKGCLRNCCESAYVVPDLVSFRSLCRATGCTPEEFLARYCMEGDAAGIPRLKSGPCCFLKDQICSVYPSRSLICRFYLCTNIAGETEELVYSIVTCGVAALFRWLEERRLIRIEGRGQTGFDRALLELVERYRFHPGTSMFLKAGSYNEILLAPFLPHA